MVNGRRIPSRLAGLASLGALVVLLWGAGPAVGDEAEDEVEVRKRELVFQLRVRNAIERGMLWVAAQQQRDGSFRLEGNHQQGFHPQNRHRFGESALATLTLAHCGMGPENPVMRRALAYLRKHYRSLTRSDYWPQASSYSLSIVVLALHTLFAREEAFEDEDEDARRYGSSLAREEDPCRYPRRVAEMIEDILDWLVANRAERGLFRYPGPLPGGPSSNAAPGGPWGLPTRGPDFAGPEDMSNTQYVLLALWAGVRCGYDVEPAVLERVARRLLAVQEAEGPLVVRRRDPGEGALGRTGRYADTSRPPPEVEDRARGFAYTPGGTVTGSMTTAGLSSLAIVKAMLMEMGALAPDLGRDLDRGIWDAIAWLAHHYSVRENPPSYGPIWHYYYLYGLERACVIVGKRFLGDHDWYREGARMLIDDQHEDGSWDPPDPVASRGGPPGPQGPAYRSDLLDTCFALLFLKRATIEPKVPVLPEPVITPPEEAPAGE